MSGVTTKHNLSAVAIGATVLGGIGQQSADTGTEVRSDQTSGEIFPRHQSIVRQEPTLTFDTFAVAAGLTAVPILGTKISELAGMLNTYAQLHEDEAGRAAGSSHREYKFNQGILYLVSLNATHDADASLSLAAMIAWDGTNDPIVVTEGVALPAGIDDTERFGLGPMVIGGVTIDHLKTLEIDFGIQAIAEGSDSDVWPKFTSIETANPVLTITGINLATFKATNIPLEGKAGTHANSTFYLRKRTANGSGFLSDVTVEHVKVTAAGLIHVGTPYSGQGGSAAEVTLRMPLKFDGTNAPLVITPASAIT